MSSSFFLKKEPKNNKKRKFQGGGGAGAKGKGKDKTNETPAKKRPQKDDEEIASDSEYESGLEGDGAPNLAFSSDEAEEETPQDKRLRLAKQYLEEIEKQEADKAEDRELHDHVAHRLQTEYLDSVGKLRKKIAGSIEGYDAENIIKLKHKKQHLPLCSLALSPDGQYLLSGAKTQYVLKWNLKTLRVEGSFNVQPYNEDKNTDIKRRSHVIALCISSDFRYLALADGGHTIQIWCPKELKHLKTFHGHRDVVTSLVFRRDTHELYSASRDRSVKIWSLDEMAYVESLFGHQAPVTGIDALSRERAVTSGSDCTLRIWKITEESQLIYNGHRDSIEAVKFLNDENFISCGTDGSLGLWNALKKKPLHTSTLVHGTQANGEANWITAISCVVNTDLVASGSCDGYIRLWQCVENYRKLKPLLEIPVNGFVNSLVFNADGTKLYAAVGQEHRWGRWWRLTDAKNHIVVIDLLKASEAAEDAAAASKKTK
ncbi:U3 small nucleolar RNA-interacting protein 2 [Musca domestica]|uniref:U3 small nucleolar RNA-interacting protein 2 n=1 Tax=Musca domestica TaxID=7370 RepID=A0A9J7CKR6_MUSDO|nr:U3 small nucleolar RNA-interacting protein 2 [Musca domestica]